MKDEIFQRTRDSSAILDKQSGGQNVRNKHEVGQCQCFLTLLTHPPTENQVLMPPCNFIQSVYGSLY